MKICCDCGISNDRSRCRKCVAKLRSFRKANGQGRLINHCADCGKEIQGRSKRCNPCQGKIRSQKLQACKKRKCCLDCGKEIKPQSKRCNSCALKHKWTIPEIRQKIVTSSSIAHFKGGTGECLDCGERLKNYNSKRCPSCAQEYKWKTPKFRVTMNAKNPLFSKGENNPRWSGGNDDPESWRYSNEAKKWKRKVKQRDGYTCQICHDAEKRVIAHHIKPAKLFRELRFEVGNGIALCRPCHGKVHFGSIIINGQKLTKKLPPNAQSFIFAPC